MESWAEEVPRVLSGFKKGMKMRGEPPPWLECVQDHIGMWHNKARLVGRLDLTFLMPLSVLDADGQQLHASSS